MAAQIAFTSDRGGGNNLWRIGVDGEPGAGQQGGLPPAQQPGVDAGRALPDRPQALHRQRSLGAGELWMYHAIAAAAAACS
jgi:hypothetical protein